MHLENIANGKENHSDDFIVRATGRYYTHKNIANHINDNLIAHISKKNEDRKSVRIIDPFGGDARLVKWLLRAWRKHQLPEVNWIVEIWDIGSEGLNKAKETFVGYQ